jgi:hypothetical protein
MAGNTPGIVGNSSGIAGNTSGIIRSRPRTARKLQPTACPISGQPHSKQTIFATLARAQADQCPAFHTNQQSDRKGEKEMPDYLPATDSDLLVWFNNFQLKFPAYAPSLGFSTAEAIAVTDDYNMLAFVIHAAEAVRNEAQARTSYKNALRDGTAGTVAPMLPSAATLPLPSTIVAPGIIPRLRAIVQRLKAHPSYTESMGTDLGVIATLAAQPTTPAKPTATAVAEPGSTVRINWVKAGFDGVLVESQRAGEAGWTLLATDTQSPYIDTSEAMQAGVPELRRYRLRYVKSDVPVGSYSDEMTVTTTP